MYKINFIITSTIITPIAADIDNPNANAMRPLQSDATTRQVILLATLLDIDSAMPSFLCHTMLLHQIRLVRI